MHRTAISRKDISAPMRWMLENDLFNVDQTIIHYGEGRAYMDTRALRMTGASVVEYEPYPAEGQEFKARMPGVGYDVCVAIYVLNVLPPYERQMTITAMHLIADRSIVAVRTDKIAGTPHLDGVITKAGTFQKSFTRAECEELGKVLTFNSSFAIIEL